MTPGGPRSGDASTATAITCVPRELGSRGLCCNSRRCFRLLRSRRRGLFLHWRRALLLGRKHHHHLPALEARELLDHAYRVEVLLHPLQQALAELLVRHLAAAETQRHLGLVAILEELDQLPKLDLIVTLVGSGPELDFLDLDLLLLELGFV